MQKGWLHNILLTCIQKILETGLDLRVVVFDQGSNNTSVAKSLKVTKDQPFFYHNGKKIILMYDPPHLRKNTRKNWKKDGYTLGEDEVMWEHLETLFAEDQKVPLKWRLAPRLTKKHIWIPAFGTMNVRRAAQVLSHSVAAGIYTLLWYNQITPEAAATAEFVETFDGLFNCFNAFSTQGTHPLCRPISSTSDHDAYFSKCKKWLPVLKSRSQTSLPCLNGWLQNIEGVQILWADLESEFGLKYLMTKRLNQDALEIFYSTI